MIHTDNDVDVILTDAGGVSLCVTGCTAGTLCTHHIHADNV